MRKGIALLAIGLTTLGALAVSEAAEASTARYCGTTADGFPGLRAVGPTSCGFAKRVGDAWERKRVPLYEIRASMWMPRPGLGARLLAQDAPELPDVLPDEADEGFALRHLHRRQRRPCGPGVVMSLRNYERKTPEWPAIVGGVEDRDDRPRLTPWRWPRSSQRSHDEHSSDTNPRQA